MKAEVMVAAVTGRGKRGGEAIEERLHSELMAGRSGGEGEARGEGKRSRWRSIL